MLGRLRALPAALSPALALSGRSEPGLGEEMEQGGWWQAGSAFLAAERGFLILLSRLAAEEICQPAMTLAWAPRLLSVRSCLFADGFLLGLPGDDFQGEGCN